MKITLDNIDHINTNSIEWGDTGDYKGVDSFIEYAEWLDGTELVDDELDQINNEFAYYFDARRLELWCNHQADLADYYRDLTNGK